MAETGKEAHAPRAIAERRDLVHVEPDARELDTRVRPVPEGLRPDSLRVLMEKVGKDLMYAH